MPGNFWVQGAVFDRLQGRFLRLEWAGRIFNVVDIDNRIPVLGVQVDEIHGMTGVLQRPLNSVSLSGAERLRLRVCMNNQYL